MYKYKLCALAGTVIMGVSSFIACLAENGSLITIGNIGLLISIGLMSFAFSKWQP